MVPRANLHEIDPGATDFWVYELEYPGQGYWVDAGPNPTINVGSWPVAALSVVTTQAMPLPTQGCRVRPLSAYFMSKFLGQYQVNSAHWVFPGSAGYRSEGNSLSHWSSMWPSATWWRVSVGGSVVGFAAFVAGPLANLQFLSLQPGAAFLNQGVDGPLPMDFGKPLPVDFDRVVYPQV